MFLSHFPLYQYSVNVKWPRTLSASGYVISESGMPAVRRQLAKEGQVIECAADCYPVDHFIEGQQMLWLPPTYNVNFNETVHRDYSLHYVLIQLI